MRNRFLHSMVLSLALSLFTIIPAQAVLVSFSDQHTSSQTEWTDTLTVSQFDPLLGTLNSATLTFDGNILSDMTLDNDNTTGINAIGNVNVVLSMTSVSGIAGTGFFINPTGSTGIQSLGGDDSGDTDSPGHGGPDENTISGITGFDSQVLTFNTGDPELSAFIGTGTLSTIELGTIGGFGVTGGGGNVDVNVNTFADATLKVEYDYTPSQPGPNPIPEPSTMLLLGSGLVGLAMWRWKTAHPKL